MFAHDSDLELFRDNFRRFLAENIAPHYAEWERTGIMPREVWNQMGENGFLCVDMPEEYGGYGVSTRYSMMLVEEASRAGFGSLSTAISVHSEIVAPYILHIGTEAQKQYWIPKMVLGEAPGAIGMTVLRLLAALILDTMSMVGMARVDVLHRARGPNSILPRTRLT